MRVRSALAATLFVAVLVPALAHAAKPDFDAVAARTPGAAARERLERLRTDPSLRALGAVTGTDDRLGVPTFVRVPAAAPSATRLPLAAAARAHVSRLAPLYGLDAADVSSAPLERLHDTGRGPVIARFGQVIDGVRVFRDRLTLLMNRDGALLAATGYVPGRALGSRGGARAFTLGAAAAIGAALRDYGAPVDAGSLRRQAALPGGYDAYAAPVPGLEPVRVTRVWFHEPEALRAAYYLELVGESDAYGYVVSATDGAILFRNDLVHSDAFTYRAWADGSGAKQPWDGPQGTAPTPHPTATDDSTVDPALTAPGLVSLQNGPLSTNDPWLAPGATQTKGNNVDAYADLASPDGFSGGDLRATVTSPGTFDRTFNVTQDPAASSTQRQASIAQLFYTTNWLHDAFYDAGFTEAAGNAQASNYGRGGVEGDALRAEAQDYGGTNNANMRTPADGASPRMQMYLFTPSTTRLTVQAPPSLAGDEPAGAAPFGPQSFDVTADVVAVVDAFAPVADGCNTPYANAAQLAGRIALIDKGTCTYVAKVKNAQTQGAIAVIVVNDGPAAADLTGSDPSITIPSIMVSQADGNAIRAQLGSGTVTVRMRRVSLRRDGSLDAQIVAHEWGHYISNRLVGDASGLANPQGNAMGEGWADFHALLITVRPEDAAAPANAGWSGTYAMGAYSITTTGLPTDAYYFGLRRVPYSTDLAKNGLLFRHVQHGVPLPAVPTSFGQDGMQNEEAHNTGEVWCTMLWECYAALLNDTGRLTFAEAQSRMIRYLVAAYELTPVSPTIVEARDALLAAAYAADPADHALFCAAFAKRGCGIGAVAPDRWSFDFAGVVESGVCGGDLALAAATLTDEPQSCDHDGMLDVNETGRLDLVLANTGSTPLSGTTVTVSSENPALSFPAGTTFAVPASTPFTTTSVSIPVHLDAAGGTQVLDLQLGWNDSGFAVATGHAAVVNAYGNADAVPSSTETFEEPSPLWAATGSPHVATFGWRRKELAATTHRFVAPDVGTKSDEWLVSPPLAVGASPFVISFASRWSFETDPSAFYDGGVLELSTDGGAHWTDVGVGATPGYGGTIYGSSGNVLANRPAWVGTNASWPGLDAVTVNLGTAYAGKTVQVRFRLGTDEAAAGADWEVDDVQVTGVAPAPFTTLGPNAAPCVLAADAPLAPRELAFALAGPHPVAGAARFELALPRAGHVRVDVYDLSGRRAATLADGELAAGRHAVAWPAGGARVPGVYFARLAYEGRTLERRVVVMR